MILSRIERVGAKLTNTLAGFGRFVIFCVQTVMWLFRDAGNRRRWKLVWPQFYEVGTRSIPVVALTGAFIGMVLAVELYNQFRLIGQETQLGGITGITVVKHLGPVLAAVMLAGRVGGAFAAELGTMAVTEQIDALRVMGAAPVGYLVVPRVIACVIMIPIMTIFSDLLGVLGSWGIVVGSFGVTNHEYWVNAGRFVSLWDINTGLVKSIFFGMSIGLICCYKGFFCTAGAQGVGRATTDAFVTSFVTIIILNFFLAKFANDLYNILFGFVEFSPFG
ncbi:MAG: MlaE family lipid ABC transporter permease subunit [Planctomycetes bacterium]|nr:MlaE family lipid ABC transporter permease subunit [Planctomycetota bacterium]